MTRAYADASDHLWFTEMMTDKLGKVFLSSI